MAKLTRENLELVANKLTEVMGLKPAIDCGELVSNKKLKAQVVEAMDKIEPEDDFGDDVQELLDLIGTGVDVEEETPDAKVVEDIGDEDDTEEKDEGDIGDEDDTEDAVEEEPEDEAEDDEGEKEKVKKVKTKATVTKPKKSKVAPKSKIQKEKLKTVKKKESTKNTTKDFSKSNKAVVYTAWSEEGVTDVPTLLGMVHENVKKSTISGWISQWKKGENLPAIAKKK